MAEVSSDQNLIAQTIGSNLFDAVFTDIVKEIYDKSVNLASLEGKGLRIRVQFQKSPELAGLPWEFLFDKKQAQFLALSRNTSIVHYLDLPAQRRPLVVAPPLRTLLIFSSAGNQSLENYKIDRNIIRQEVEKLNISRLIEFTYLENPTPRVLKSALSQGYYHILHYCSQASFNDRTGDYTIFLQNEDKSSQLISADMFTSYLRNNPPRLVVLNSIGGSSRKKPLSFPFKGFAERLMRNGISYVLTMQYDLPDQATVYFMEMFYEALSHGVSIDGAVMQSRIALSNDPLLWAAPVLYAGQSDRGIFLVQNAESLAKAKDQTPTPAPVEPSEEGEKKVSKTEKPPAQVANRSKEQYSTPGAGRRTKNIWDDLLNRFLVRQREPAYLFYRIPPEQTDLGSMGEPFKVNEHYVRVWVSELSVAMSRKWIEKSLPLLFSVTDFIYGNESVSLPIALSSSMISGNRETERDTALNIILAGPFAYRGGLTQLSINLLQIPNSEVASVTLHLMEKISNQFSFATEIGTYLRTANTLIESMESLANIEETRLELRLSAGFSPEEGQPFSPHYGVAISARENDLDPRRMWVRNDRLYYGRNLAEARPITDLDYILYRVEQLEIRDDWKGLPFNQQYNQILQEAVQADNTSWDATKNRLQNLIDIILTSPDLTQPDAHRLVDRLTEEVKKARKQADAFEGS